MNKVIDIYTKSTSDFSNDDEKELLNFLDGLQYSYNIESFKIIYNSLISNPAIQHVKINKSYKSKKLYEDALQDEALLKVMRVEITSLTDDVDSIAKFIFNNQDINKVCSNIEQDKNKFTFTIK